MATDRQFLSIPEAAALMGVSRIAVFKKVKKGQLSAIRIGRNWAIPAHFISKPETARSPLPAATPALRETRAPKPAAPQHQHSAAKAPLKEQDPLDEMGWD